MDKKLKLITEEHKILFFKAMQIKDKKESHEEADKVIDKICEDIGWTDNKYIVVGTMTNLMLESTADILKHLEI